MRLHKILSSVCLALLRVLFGNMNGKIEIGSHSSINIDTRNRVSWIQYSRLMGGLNGNVKKCKYRTYIDLGI